MRPIYLFILLFSLLLPERSYGQNDTFTCDGSYYFATDASGSSVTDLQLVVITQFVTFQPFVIYSAIINSVGYNRKDNLIYGLETAQNQIIRMFKNGNYQLMGNPNLPSPGAYVSGDVDSGGIFSLVGGNPAYIVHYDVTGPTAIQLGNVQLYYTGNVNGNPTFYDVAYHPFNANLYGYDYNTRRLCTIDPQTGAVDAYGTYEPNTGSGALFFDVYGQLYSYMNGKMYRFDIPTGAATLVANGPATGRQDGCSCPYTIKLGKSSLPASVCPGDTFTLRYEIRNVLNDTLFNVDLYDQLPAAFTIVQISSLKGGTLAASSGPGSSYLGIENMILPPDTNIIDVRVAVDSAMSGGVSLGSQGILRDLPNLFSDTIYSDDPATIKIDDSTYTFIYPKEDNRNLIAAVPPLCVGDNLTLNANGPLNTSYHWTGPDSFESFQAVNVLLNLPPDGFGSYYVEGIQNGCTLLRDSIEIKKGDCANEYPCVSRFYMSRYSPGDSTYITLIDFDTTMTHDSISIHTDSLDATGYRFADHFIYAFDNRLRKVVRLYANGQGSLMDIQGSLPPGSYEAGAIDTAGFYVICGRSGAIVTLYVGSRKAKIIQSANLQYSGGAAGMPVFGDIAFDPWSNVCYGYDENSGRLSSIDPATGLVSPAGPALASVDVNSLFFNAFGELFAYGNGVYYRVDPGSGQFASADTSLFASVEDGSSCPYKVEMQKSFAPEAICPGEEFSITFKIANRSGKVMPFVGFYDKLHPKLSITAIEHSPGGIINPGTGVGQSQLFIYNMTLPHGIDSVRIRVKLSEKINGGRYLDNQAILVNVSGEEDTVYSDWPASLRFTDPSGLYIYPTPKITQRIDLCEGSQFWAGGAFQSSSGTYRDTLQTLHGCDSIVTTELYFHPNKSLTINAYICNGDSVFAGGAWQKVSGTYTDSFASSRGCDSVVITQLTVSNVTLINRLHEICEGDSLFLANAWRSTPGTFYDTLATSGACDSVIAHQLIVHPVKSTDVQAEICEGSSYYAGGAWQTKSGSYTDIYTTRFGCDSIVRTELSVLKKINNYLSASICEGTFYPFGTRMLSQSGNYTDTFSLASGCDSIVHLDLTVHTVFEESRSQFICTGDSVFFGGQWLKNSGSYVDSALTVYGCDSILTLQLSVGSTQLIVIDTGICEGGAYYFDNRVLTQGGSYYDTLSSGSGCDSIVRLNLQVYPNPEPDLGNDTMICQGDPFVLNPGTFDRYQWQNGSNDPVMPVSSPGTYHVTVSDARGCMALDSVQIEVRVPPYINFGPDLYRCPGFEIILDAINANADTFLWSTGDTGRIIRIQEAGEYWLRASNGCVSADTIRITEFDTLHVRLPADTSICRNDRFILRARALPGSAYLWNTGETTPEIEVFEAGTYEVIASDPNGCQSSDRFTLYKFDCVEQLFVPSAFSPNGDGINDELIVEGGEYRILESRIYDRWGHLMLASNEETLRWDGSYGGVGQPAGVYILYIRFVTRDGREHLYQGNVSLLR